MRHSGALGGNNRASKIVEILRAAGGRPVTTLEIHEATGSLAPSRDVSDARWLLKDTDEEIEPADLLWTTREGVRVYGYRLVTRMGVTV